MTLPDSTSRYHDQVQNFFLYLAQKKARETRFVRHQSPLDGSLFLQTLVFSIFQSGVLVLDELAQTAHRLNHRVEVCGQAFKERFKSEAVEFLKQMLGAAMQITAPASPRILPLLEAFSEVNLLDSSVIHLPAALKEQYPGCGGVGAKAAAKLYLVLNYLTGGYTMMRIESGRKADQNMGSSFLSGHPPQALWLFDLGFFNASFLAQISAAASFYVCRLSAAQKVFACRRANGQLAPFDLDHFLSRAPRQMFEIDLLFGRKQEVATRLVIVPVPKEVSALRRRKARQKARRNGRQAQQKTLRRCDWTLLLTNTSPEQLPTSTVLDVYSVRWQVELAFKLCKSDLGLERTRGREKHRVECEFYAKLITVLLFNRLSGVAENLMGEKLSPAKLWRRLRTQISDLREALRQGTALALSERLKAVARYAKPDSDKHHRSTFQRLQRAATQAQQFKLNDPLGKQQTTKAETREACARSIKSRKITLNGVLLSIQRTTPLPLAYGNL